MKLHGFFRSGSSHRLRIALNLKGLPYELAPVDLRTEQHLGADYKALNPQGLVPALEHEGRVLIQSLAIIEWLEERYPEPPLLPADARQASPPTRRCWRKTHRAAATASAMHRRWPMPT